MTYKKHNPNPSFKFQGSEHLKKRSQIETLFQQGKSITDFPIQSIYYLDTQSEEKGIKAAFSVPKKLHKHAITRNKIKRLMREAYRLQKFDLKNYLIKNQSCLLVMFVYKSKEIVTYKEIERKIFINLQRLQNDFIENEINTL